MEAQCASFHLLQRPGRFGAGVDIVEAAAPEKVRLSGCWGRADSIKTPPFLGMVQKHLELD